VPTHLQEAGHLDLGPRMVGLSVCLCHLPSRLFASDEVFQCSSRKDQDRIRIASLGAGEKWANNDRAPSYLLWHLGTCVRIGLGPAAPSGLTKPERSVQQEDILISFTSYQTHSQCN
jgi:hypothetical protein